MRQFKNSRFFRVIVCLLVLTLGVGVTGTLVAATSKPASAWSSYDFPPHYPNVDNPNIYSAAAYECARSHYLAANAFFSVYESDGFYFGNLRSCIDFDLMQQDKNALGRYAYVLDFYKWGGIVVQNMMNQINQYFDAFFIIMLTYAKYNQAVATVAGCAFLVEASPLVGKAKVAAGVGCDGASAFYELIHGENG